MKDNKKGSALLWAIVVVMVLEIVIAASMTIAYSYYNRSVEKNIERQAYLSAKSVVTNVTENILNKNSDYIKLIPDGTNSVTTTINDVVNGKHTFPEALGKLKSLTLSVSTKTVDDVEYVFLTISGTVTYASKTCTISADLKRLVTESNKNWTLIKYYEGSKEVQLPYNIQTGKDTYDSIDTIFTYFKNGDKAAMQEEYKKHGISVTDGLTFNNDKLRIYIYQVLMNGSSPKLNMDEFNLPKSLAGSQLYAHVMFGVVDGEPVCFIYATATESGAVSDWKPILVFDPITQHWYFRVNQWGNNDYLSMSQLNSGTPENRRIIYDNLISSFVEENIADK